MAVDFSRYGDEEVTPLDFSKGDDLLPFIQQPLEVRERIGTDIARRFVQDIPSPAGNILDEPRSALPRITARDASDAGAYFTGAPSTVPGRVAQTVAGAQNVASRFTESMMEPESVAMVAAGGLPGLVGRAATGYFAVKSAAATPELARRAGTASVEGDTQANVEAIGELSLNALMAGLMANHTGRGIARDIPALRRALLDKVETQFTPQQLREMYGRVQAGQSTARICFILGNR